MHPRYKLIAVETTARYIVEKMAIKIGARVSDSSVKLYFGYRYGF